MARIFVSSTFKDLEECREKVRLTLRRMGHEDVSMEYFVAEDKRPVDKCLEDVASCDLYVGIFAWRYGYTPDGYDKSITELEYRKAVEKGKNCLSFLLHEEAPWAPRFVDKGTDASKIEALRNELSTKCMVSFFKSADELASLVGASIYNWKNERISNSASENAKSIEKMKLIDFDKYTKTIYDKYRNLDLDTLTPSQREEYIEIELSNVFVEQNVRERMPPVELPKEMWKKVQEQWDPDKKYFPEGLKLEEIKTEKESYYSKEPKAVLDVVTDDQNKQLVILGDPGSGKSTLTKYLLLSILNIKYEERIYKKFNGYLPLLIELRKFTAIYPSEKCESFLDYFDYLDKKAIFDLPKAGIEKYIEDNGKVLVIFDGLDEVFDPAEWETIVHMIAGFKNRYPRTRIIVTSRIVGYKRSILEDAGFTHYTIQEFEETQITEFLNKWYSKVLRDEEEISEKKARIFRALKESNSIRELAGNPLLLTILAIVGKHQELPRERWKLYDHAAGILIEHWDINRHLKDKQIKIDFIGEEDKKELLMRIACRMQSSSRGLAVNFIHKKDLHEEIEEYLKFRYRNSPSESKLITVHMINQLRARNFILCLYGADIFGFVHRTFLEYFCAMDIVKRFDNHELNIESLKKEFYEKYWEDPAWHEVLRLICAMKDKFAGEIIGCLLQAYNPQYFGDRPPLNISLAIKCLSELRNPGAIEREAEELLKRVLKLFEMVRWTQDINQFLAEEVVPAGKLVGDRWPHKDLTICQFSRSQVYVRYYPYLNSPDPDLNLNNAWTEFIAEINSNSKKLYKESLSKVNYKRYSSLLDVLILGKCEQKDKDLFSLFFDFSSKSRYYFVRQVAIQELARGWHNYLETLRIIKKIIANDENEYVRSIAVQELARGWHDDPETLGIIREKATNDENEYVRSTAVQELARGWHDELETLKIIKQSIAYDENEYVRSSAIQELARGWLNDSETLWIIKQSIANDENEYVRSTAVQELVRGWNDDLETLRIIKQSANSDENNYVKQVAVQELARGWHNDLEIFKFIKQSADNDENRYIRLIAIQELARGWHDDSEILKIIKKKITNDEYHNVRSTAVQELARGWHDDSETLGVIKQIITNDENEYVRSTAVQELARGWHDDSETLWIIKQSSDSDENEYVRSTAIQELARGWHDDLETLRIIKQRTSTDKNGYVRSTAVQELARRWHDDLETSWIIREKATKDENEYVRSSAVQELARGWYDDPETLRIIKQRASTDKNGYVRSTAVQELARGWHNDPETLWIIKQSLANDEKKYAQNIGIYELFPWMFEKPNPFKIIKQSADVDAKSYGRNTDIQRPTQGLHNDLEVLKIIKQKATSDRYHNVRYTAVQELARGWYDCPETIKIIKQRASTDKNEYVRLIAVQELARGWHDDPETLSIIKQRAAYDENGDVRQVAIKELACGWHNDPETLKFIKLRAICDMSRFVRSACIHELARWWHDDPETPKFIKQRANNDEKGSVRRSACQELQKRWFEEAEEKIGENVSSEITIPNEKSTRVLTTANPTEYARPIPYIERKEIEF